MKESDNQEGNVGKRLKVIREKLNLTQAEFAKGIDIEQSYLSRIENGGKGLGKRLLKVIFDTYNVNGDWLIKGQGQPFSVEKKSRFEADEIGYPTGEDSIITERSGNEFIDTQQGDSYMAVPLVEYQAYAGYLGGWNDPEYIEDLPKHWINVDKRYRGLYRAFVVRGNSMNDGTLDSIIDGDIVTCRLIEKDFWTSKFHMHQYSNFVIVHKDGILVKELKDHEVGNGKIVVRSRNPDKDAYPDQELDLKDVYEILNVLETSRKLRMK